MTVSYKHKSQVGTKISLDCALASVNSSSAKNLAIIFLQNINGFYFVFFYTYNEYSVFRGYIVYVNTSKKHEIKQAHIHMLVLISLSPDDQKHHHIYIKSQCQILNICFYLIIQLSGDRLG